MFAINAVRWFTISSHFIPFGGRRPQNRNYLNEQKIYYAWFVSVSAGCLFVCLSFLFVFFFLLLFNFDKLITINLWKDFLRSSVALLKRIQKKKMEIIAHWLFYGNKLDVWIKERNMMEITAECGCHHFNLFVGELKVFFCLFKHWNSNENLFIIRIA